MLTFNEYEAAVLPLAVYPKELGLLYPTLGLAGEAGEFCEKIKKVYRDFKGEISSDKQRELLKELGDIMWYVMAAANELGSSIEEVATVNIEKLTDRAERGKLHGSGDNR